MTHEQAQALFLVVLALVSLGTFVYFVPGLVVRGLSRLERKREDDVVQRWIDELEEDQ